MIANSISDNIELVIIYNFKTDCIHLELVMI